VSGWIIASEGAEMIEILAVDPRHGVITDDLVWGRPRRRPYRKTTRRRPALESESPAAGPGFHVNPPEWEASDDG
jgi:hypothetical protein